MDQMKRERER